MVQSEIEWTDKVWNPSTGCTKVSPGCKNCYAERASKRLHGMGKTKYANKFEYTEHPTLFELPTSWKKPSMVFVNSMSDLFHENTTQGFLDSVFNTMVHLAPRHVYQVLTKRADRLASFSREFSSEHGESIPSHIWVGVSVEDRLHRTRIDRLRETQACTKFISFEPLLEDLGTVDLTGIDWVIIGGESGPGYRLVKRSWIKDLIDQCKAQDVAVFFKQWGGLYPKQNGRVIDGHTYSEYPSTFKGISNV